MYTNQHTVDRTRTAVGRRRVLSWLGGVGVVAFVGALVAPLKGLHAATVSAAPSGSGLVGQRLVYAHVEPDEFAVGGHTHDASLYVKAADFDRPSALEAVLAYPERLVGAADYGVLVHRLDPAAFLPPMDLALTDGGFAAYGAGCPVCGSLLRWTEDGTPTGRGVDRCPEHGCEYDPYRGGAPVAGPTTVRLPQVGVGVGPDGVLTLTTGDLGATNA